jgi:hypothetical protein
MSLTYATYQTALAALMVTTPTEAGFTTILPTIIDYAEQRIYRDLGLLATVVRQSGTLTANSRDFTLPSGAGRFVAISGINVYTPVATTAIRHPLTAATRDVVDTCWPSETAASAATVPALFAMLTDQAVILGPPPGAGFTAEVIGTIRPTPLSASNTTTFLASFLPDLFLAASMVFAAGYQKNFGGQSDDPRMSQSWETQYQTLKASADTEETRKKFAAAPAGA